MNVTTIDSRSRFARVFSFKSSCPARAMLSAALGIALLCFAMISQAQATPMNYGSHTGNTVQYIDVTEESNSGDALPLFGAPLYSGDSIDFNPVGFDANASNGSTDITDSNLTFMVKSLPNFVINNITFHESGDTTLAGIGNDNTFTKVTADGVLNIHEVNGVGIPVISKLIALTFTPSNGDYGLATDAGGGPFYHTQWSGSLNVNLNQILAQNGFPNGQATKISIDLDNTLSAHSQNGTSALIAKKDFGGVSITINGPNGGGIPEPATLALAIFGVGALAAGRRRPQI
jgi:hypothetical protein